MKIESRDFRSLMESLKCGCQDAAWELVSTYGRHVERMVRRRLSRPMRSKHDTRDVIQAVWASSFRDRERFGAFDDAEGIVAILVGAARNKVLHETHKRYDTLKSDIRRESPLARIIHELNPIARNVETATGFRLSFPERRAHQPARASVRLTPRANQTVG